MCQTESASALKIILRASHAIPKTEIENCTRLPFALRTVVVARHCRPWAWGWGHRGYQREGQGVRPGQYRREKFWRIWLFATSEHPATASHLDPDRCSRLRAVSVASNVGARNARIRLVSRLRKTN